MKRRDRGRWCWRRRERRGEDVFYGIAEERKKRRVREKKKDGVLVNVGGDGVVVREAERRVIEQNWRSESDGRDGRDGRWADGRACVTGGWLEGVLAALRYSLLCYGYLRLRHTHEHGSATSGEEEEYTIMRIGCDVYRSKSCISTYITFLSHSLCRSLPPPVVLPSCRPRSWVPQRPSSLPSCRYSLPSLVHDRISLPLFLYLFPTVIFPLSPRCPSLHSSFRGKVHGT